MFSTLVRRTHMYLALFLVPWMLMYALSTFVMNHRPFFQSIYGEGPAEFVQVDQQTYPGGFSEDANSQFVAQQILKHLGMDGAHNVRGNLSDDQITINRHDLVNAKRITYKPSNGALIVEQQKFQSPAFLERFHRRRGYGQDYWLDDVWAFTVDIVIVVMIFWVLSGLWMWWELEQTHRWGLISAASGLTMFLLFLFLI